MSRILVSDLSFTHAGSDTPVFEHATFEIDTDWKLGFVGRNGRGKTTFLKLLAGEYAYSGRIQSSESFTYFPFPVPHPDRTGGAVLETLCPQAELWQIRREVSLLDMEPDDVLYRPFSTLSGGERTKLMLAALFLRPGQFLLIDEPTNHLDGRGRAALARYLNRKRGYILVSHDRAFLDGCVDHILAINRTGLEVRQGNFSAWYQSREARDAYEQARQDSLRREAARLQDAARQASGWSERLERTKHGSRNAGLRPDRGYIGHKSAKMMKRSKTIERRTRQAADEAAGLLRDLERSDPLSIRPLPYPKAVLAELDGVAVQYGDAPVCREVSFQVRQGDRIALVGGNGTGKTSLLELIGGKELRHTGVLRLGGGLILSCIPQDASFLQGNLRDFAREHGLEETRLKTILRKLDFSRDLFERDMSGYSAGQKKKVLLARSLCQQAHLYLWDEPLNYVDVLSRVQIENLILEHRPAMLFVEHDLQFSERVATRQVRLLPYDAVQA